MTTYILTLKNGRKRKIIAPTTKKAENKFYSSNYHFRTEMGIKDIERLKDIKMRKSIERKAKYSYKPMRKRRKRYNPYGFGYGGGVLLR